MSLVMPDHFDRRFNLISIDPGSNSVGFARTEIDVVTSEILSIWAMTIQADRLLLDDGCLTYSQPDRMIRLIMLQRAMCKLMGEYNAHHVACESPFFNSKFPNAYGALVEAMNHIRLGVFDYSPSIPFTTLPPSSIKQAILAGGGAGKDAVKKAVLNNSIIAQKTLVNLQLLDEHAIDAIAVGYSHWALYFKDANHAKF